MQLTDDTNDRMLPDPRADEKLQWAVARIMSTSLLTCAPSTPLGDAARMMTEAGYSSILVVNQHGGPAGIWTEHDALSIDLDDPDQMSIPVAAVMSSPVRSVMISATLEDLMIGFKDFKIRHFVVLDGARPVGMVTQTDLIRHQGIHAYLTLRDVGSLARRNPLMVDARAKLSDVARRLKQSQCEAAIVLFDGKADGILTERDVLRQVAERKTAMLAGEICSRPLVTAPVSEPLVQAHDRMEQRRIRHMGVVDEMGAVIAVVSFGDILDAIELSYSRHMHDVLARQKEALRMGEERQRKLLGVTQQGFVELDAQHSIVQVNDALCTLLALPPEDLIGRSVLEMCPPGSQDVLKEQFSLISLTDHRSYEISIRHASGRLIPVEVKATTLRSGDGSVVGSFALISDLSESQRQRAEIDTLLEQVSQSNAELEAFAYVISHDLQEPLRMIASYMGLIERRFPDKLDDEGREFIGFAVEGAKRMQSMITDLLEYSRVQRHGHRFAPCDTNQCLNSAQRNLIQRLEDTGGVVKADVLPVVMADASQVVRLFQCLLDNAINFRDPSRPPRIRIGARRSPEGKQWIISVRDNGIGIEAEFSERIFQMFQRLHARGRLSGNGIGLAVCKRIVERHHGQIWVESTVGEGSTFFFTLPAMADDEDGDINSSAAHASLNGNGEAERDGAR